MKKLGIISNSDSFIPLAYTLAAQQLQVYIFYSPSKDEFVNQKVYGFIQQSMLPFVAEKNTEKDIYKWLQDGNYDVCFVSGYTYLINVNKLKHLHTQFFNIHFGLLPMFKGPVPVFWQLKKGMDKIGLSIHLINEKFDDGAIVWTKEVPDLPHYNYQIVHQIFSQLCIEGVLHILRFIQIKIPVPLIGSLQKPGYQKRPALNDVMINWQQMNAKEICNLIRACNPWNKGALTVYNKQELKLMDAGIIIASTDLQGQDLVPGTIVKAEEQLHIYCKDGDIININTIFYNDCFIPAYQCRQWDFIKGNKLG